MNKMRYEAPVIDLMGKGPLKSICIKSKGFEALEVDKEIGSLWLFAN